MRLTKVNDSSTWGTITDNAELVYKMYARKQSTYFVNKVYPKLGLEFLDFDVIRRAKKMAMSRMDNHPWTDMSEEEILRSSGLILADPETGKEGITLAAILLFGKNSTIMSVLPQYKTDAIYRVKNMDRYDDREVIITNLVDSFRRLMDFGKKHLNDVFVTEGNQSISARDKILREVVSNILAHRDYANAYTAQFVIERDKLYTKNSNLPHGHGELELNKFEPFPKNPPISKVFREIGYADELGSGMRNTNKYTKLYSGGVPRFVEENTFEIIIPIENVPELRVGGNGTQDGTQDGTQQRMLVLVLTVIGKLKRSRMMYQPIDQVKTGIKLKMMLKAAGYDVKYIQEYLHLSCPQSIYRWFKGKVLPSVEHLCALSRLLNVHMEELLVLQGETIVYDMVGLWDNPTVKRLLAYAKHIQKAA